MRQAKRNKRVIVVDDDEAVRDSLTALLLAEGYEAKSYASCRAFSRHEQKATLSCLILDHYMKPMTGLELVEHLQAKNWQIPIILISGNIRAAARKRVAELGVTAILEKPFSDRDLLNPVRHALGEANAT